MLNRWRSSTRIKPRLQATFPITIHRQRFDNLFSLLNSF